MSKQPLFTRAVTLPSKPRTSTYRQYHVPYTEEEVSNDLESSALPADLISYCRDNIIGADTVIHPPFGPRRLVYCDWTASGRAVSFIEQYIAEVVLPVYANTHTTTSLTGLQSSLFRRDARQIISTSCNATADDVVIFAGSGSTAAIHVFLAAISQGATHTRLPANGLFAVVGLFEHHSILLPLREYGYTVHTVRMTESGIDLENLRQICALAPPASVRVGMFSACSNISGILIECDPIAAILNEFGFYSLFDYASAAPYVPMDMNPNNDPRLAKTAIVCSPHKFLGGPSTAGVLIVKKAALENDIPSAPGGGTVFFVTRNTHRYLKQHEEREEGGTPDLVAAVRTGLVFQLKDAIGAEYIFKHELDLSERVRKRLAENAKIVILDGGSRLPKLPIISFLIRHPDSGLFINHRFVSVLLNDLFGIQSRSGWLCAVPYGMALLRMTDELGAEYEDALHAKLEILRPGYTRLSWHYTMTDEVIDGIVAAVHFIADHGWKLLPVYSSIPVSGEWRHKDVLSSWKEKQSLLKVRYVQRGITYPLTLRSESVTRDLHSIIEEMKEVVSKTVSTYLPRQSTNDDIVPSQFAHLKWFITPNDALDLLTTGQHNQLPKFNICPISID